MIAVGASTSMIVALAILILFGVPVAVALGVVSLAAVYAATSDWQTVMTLLASSAYDGLRIDTLIAVPLLMLMGEFIARSGAALDLMRTAGRVLHAVPGGPGLAAGLGSAVASFAAAGSTAGAASFSQAAYEELRRRGYHRAQALGISASGSVLGMLLPPSGLMLTWAILTRQEVGAVLLAVLVPAALVVIGFVAMLLTGAGKAKRLTAKAQTETSRAWVSLTGLALIFAVVLGGVGTHVLSPAEAASAGAAIALASALGKGMRPGAIVEAILAAGRASAPILLLIFAALLFAQALAATGAGVAIQTGIGSFGTAGALITMIAVWLVVATVLDPLSAVALTATLFVPAGATLGIDPLMIVILGVFVLESAALVPPLGLLVFTTQAAVHDKGVAVPDIFRHVVPFLAVLFAVVGLIATFPKIATW